MLVTKKVTRNCLIEKVLPAIRALWPRSDPMPTILIQQDNVKPHINPMDVEFNSFASKEGFNIRLFFQPPNSLDLNVLDLGYFRAIQSLQYQEAPCNIDELVHTVEKSFTEMFVESLKNIFLTLKEIMFEIIKVDGGDNYKLPHMAKDKLKKEGYLPRQVECPHDLLKKVLLLRPMLTPTATYSETQGWKHDQAGGSQHRDGLSLT